MKPKSIAIIGAGISGLAMAIALRRSSHEVKIFEQAPAFGRVGAAIIMTANAVKVLDGLEIGEAVRRTAYRPKDRVSRIWDTNKETSRVELDNTAVQKYGAPQLTIHRADLMSAIEAAVPTNVIHFSKQLVGLSQTSHGVELSFKDGTDAITDGVIGADGIHSVIRRILFGPESPVLSGMSAYRSIVPINRLSQYDLRDFIKWWGPIPEGQLVTFPINQGNDLFVFATTPESDWQYESWPMAGDIATLRDEFSGYHQEPRDILDACDETLRTALFGRCPLAKWSKGKVTLIGDACHAMVPFMAQGAAILARCLRVNDDWGAALQQYERNRIERASTIRLGSHQNEWLQKPGNPDWVYGYDAWKVPLDG